MALATITIPAISTEFVLTVPVCARLELLVLCAKGRQFEMGDVTPITIFHILNLMVCLACHSIEYICFVSHLLMGCMTLILVGGDCCDSTCVSTHEFTCGEEIDGYVNIGYPNCRLPRDRWQKLHDSHIFGDPLSLSGYSVALSQSGTLMAMGEPEQVRLCFYSAMIT